MTKISQKGSEKQAEDRQLYLRRLKAKLVLLGVSQRRVAEETKISQGHICHILAGRRYNKRVIEYIERLA